MQKDMSERSPSAGRGAVFAAGLVAGCSIATLLLAADAHRRRRRERRDVGGSSSSSSSSSFDQRRDLSDELPPPSSTTDRPLPPEIRSEMLSRNSLYFSPPPSSSSSTPANVGMERITGASVLVVGLGGVGSHAAHMLARSGVGYLRLVDFDMVTLSSLNRHAVATLSDVGLPKATVLSDHLRRICPDPELLMLDPVVRMYTGDEDKDGDILDPPPSSRTGGWDVVVDAIDDVPTKVALIAHFARRGVRVLSCMGAGGKADPTRVHISDLRSASRDPLAAAVRQRLRLLGKREARDAGTKITNGSGISNGGWLGCIDDDSRLAVVYSSEKVVAGLADVTEEQREGGLHNFGAVDGMRVRVLPVLGTMPAIMGQALAAVALCELGGKPFSPVGAERVGRNVRHRLYQHLKDRERKLEDQLRDCGNMNGTHVGPIQIDPDDVEYLMAELWKNQCAVSGERLGTTLELYRWDRRRPATPNNLVLMCARLAKKFEEDFERLGDGRDGLDDAVRGRVEARLRMCVLGAEDVY